MDPALRAAFNRHAANPDLYARYVANLERRLSCSIPFRVAETPLFIPPDLRDRLATAANEIIDQISAPAVVERMKQAVPPHHDAPGMDHLPNCAQVDFAITRGPDGQLDGKVVELQAFPSLYCLMVEQSDTLIELIEGFPGLEGPWSLYFSGLDRSSFLERLRRTIVGDEDVESVVLLDLDPTGQKTFPDFAATKRLLGIDAVCPTMLEREGRRLWRRIDGRRVQVRRLYNRVVFDELEQKAVALPFSYRDDLDVSWCPHPNWYWTWSKFTLPYVDHPAVPKTRYVSDLGEAPEDLSRYVLKPLFSFAGAGVKLDVRRQDLDAIPKADRGKWIVQEKIEYEPALKMPDGNGVKGEVRMMFLRAPNEAKLTLVLPLVRLSRGKMLGVDHNKDLTWVGGSVGLWRV